MGRQVVWEWVSWGSHTWLYVPVWVDFKGGQNARFLAQNSKRVFGKFFQKCVRQKCIF